MECSSKDVSVLSVPMEAELMMKWQGRETVLTCSCVDGGEPQQEVEGTMAEVVGGRLTDGCFQQGLVEPFVLHQWQPL